MRSSLAVYQVTVSCLNVLFILNRTFTTHALEGQTNSGTQSRDLFFVEALLGQKQGPAVRAVISSCSSFHRLVVQILASSLDTAVDLYDWWAHCSDSLMQFVPIHPALLSPRGPTTLSQCSASLQL